MSENTLRSFNDRGHGMTINQGSDSTLGVPEFTTNGELAPVRNGKIYSLEGNRISLVAIIDEDGLISYVK